ncbi:ATPase family AAA domain-containing protein 5 isoform X2 [Denticeps clupeoides]|uniref:ATPase family AAA domain-containing protein 5 isoform X2 n=1 Tax=Denticeps clupeoides TaxID=299321 RepID=UPI0010A56844|nr:ATPase family AAA domain-containing protein 5 isoform X2 [Denticeps clupeoides]
MAGLVAMASVLEDFEAQPDKKPRKDGDTNSAKTITNYFMPVAKTVEKPFSPSRSNNIMSYFHRTPPSKEKSNSSSPQMGKEILLQSPEDLNSPSNTTKHGKGPVKKQVKKRKAVKKLQELNHLHASEDCVVLEGPDMPVVKDVQTAVALPDRTGKESSLNARRHQSESSEECEELSSTPKVVPPQQSELEDVSVDEGSPLNRSTVTISFEEFIHSQSHDEGVQPDMLRAVSPAELPVSPRTLTVQAEVHPVSPDHNPIGFMEKKMASIFTSNKRDRNKTVATQQGRAENLPTPVRRSNVVLEEDDLELAVLESSSTPRCSVEEVKQFMNAFKQPSQDGAKSKSSKKQKLTKDELEEKKKCSEELIMDQTEPEPPKEDKAAADCRRTRTRKKPAKKSAEQENGAPVMETAGSSAEAPDLPTVREVRRSTRDISRTSRRQESAAQDRPPTTTPKTGRYRAEMLAPPDSKGSPIRMKLIRVIPTSLTKSGESDFEILSPLVKKELKKQKRAKKLVQKARALQQSRKPAPARQSPRRPASARTSYRDDEDTIISLELDESPPPPSQKRLCTVNDVLRKNGGAGRTLPGTKVAPLFLGKKPQRSDDSSRDASENSQDDEQFRARRDFLKSGLPDSFKKQMAKTAASLEAYSQSSSSFQASVHIQQRDADCGLWRLSWPASPQLSGLHESLLPAPEPPQIQEAPLGLCAQAAVKTGVPISSGSREDFSEAVRQHLLEEIGASDPAFPVRRMFSHFLKRQSAAEPHLDQKVSSVPITEPATGKRKRVEGDGPEKVVKKLRPSRNAAEVMAGTSVPSTPDPEPPRRGRAGRSKRRKALEVSPAEAVILLDSPSSDTICPEDAMKEDMLWTEKYQPQHSQDIVGNAESVRKVHSWLREWKLRADREDRKNQHERKPASDCCDSWLTDGLEGGEEMEDLLCNTLLITGPTGIGKTATVYACAHELGFKVFEVNCSSQRSGRQILSQLKEATQSHQVDLQGVNALKPTFFNSCSISSISSRAGSSPGKLNSPRRVVSSPHKPPQSPRRGPSKRGALAPTSLASFFKSGSRAEAREASGHAKPLPVSQKAAKTKESSIKRAAEEPGKRTATSLILFEEVDVIFDEDSGFLAAIKTFMSTTKRPVILTTSDPTFRSTFDGCFDEVHFETPSLVSVGSYLQVLCLAENMCTDPQDLHSMLHWMGGDVRRSLLQMQFWSRSGGALRSESTAAAAGGDPVGLKTRPHLPPCDTGCTRSLLGLLNVQPQEDLLDLKIMDHRNPRCWDLLAEARRSGLDLLYSNFEVLLPLPTRTLVHSTFSQPAEPRSVTLKPDPALMVDEAGADPSPLKISSRMKQKKQLGFRGKELFQSDSESDEDVLVLPKSQNSAVKGEERQAEVQRVMTPAEKQRSVPVSRCLDSLSGFLDTMSFLDSSLSHEDLQVEGATSWPSAFGWPGPEVKSGLMDEPRLERLRPQPADGRWQEVWAAAESLSFGRCRAELEEAWRRTPTLPEEVRQAAVEDLTLPVAPHRQTFSLTRNVPLSHPAPVQRRRRELMSGLCGGWPLSTLGNRAAVVLDYLPALRAVCRAERLKEQGRVKRRFLHYLDGTGLPKKTLQDLAAEF